MEGTPFTIILENGIKRTFFEEKGMITSAEMSMKVADWRCLSFYIMLDFEGKRQGFGGNMLGKEEDYDKPYCIDLRERINKLFGTNDWSQLKGKTAYAIRLSEYFDSSIIGLKNENGYMFFIEHWRRDHFSDVEGYKKLTLPIRYEVPDFSPKRSRLEEVQ